MPPVDVAAEVKSNLRLSADYNVVALNAPEIAASASPGQFVMIKVGTDHDPLLRRPFSVFEVLRDAGGTPIGISLLNKRIGPSTALLYAARPGQSIACFGPLGRPFTPVAPPIEAWMVAGGVGLAPFATLSASLRSRGVRSTLFYGARRAAELFYVDFFRRLEIDLVLTTEDGSAGERGRVIGPLERALARRPPDDPVIVYACGPEGMLAATAKAAARHGRPCQVSVERIMGCGTGGCYSCVVPMRDDSPTPGAPSPRNGTHYVRSCLAGPVLAADHVVWD